ncbi:MAG: N-formylglutamate amidohydrolase [Bacteroidales bacterium]|nr:N-formylglutamate amidohydrolase [Bacteroidales bacterium]
MEQKLLLHIPHSSTSFPEESGYTFDDLNNDERLLIDYYTDELFLPEQPSANIESVVFPYCRLYCDVERLINDPLEKEGLGISYLRRTYNPTQQPRFFSTLQSAFPLYADHHSLVAKKLVSMGDGTLLIDCHSFSSIPNMLNSNPPDIDICIGYNNDDTRPDNAVLLRIFRHFTLLGYKVGINTPFSNSKTFHVPVKYSSVMIEVNKRLYMDERTLGRTEGFDMLKREILELFDVLQETVNDQ